MTDIARTAALFFITACAEILGCYLPYLYLRSAASPWVLFPGAISLAIFAWLLTLHPSGAGRTYAAYGGVYVATAGFGSGRSRDNVRSMGPHRRIDQHRRHGDHLVRTPGLIRSDLSAANTRLRPAQYSSDRRSSNYLPISESTDTAATRVWTR